MELNPEKILEVRGMNRTERLKQRQKKSKRIKLLTIMILVPALLLGLAFSDHITEGRENNRLKESQDEEENQALKEPVEDQKEKEPLHAKKTADREEDVLRVLFLGDSMMTGNVAGALDQHGMDYPLREFAPVLQAADLIVVNLETAVGTSGELMEEKSFAFQTDPQYLELFEPYKDKLVFTLANNHGMDAPVMETIQELETEGFHYVGIGRNQQEAFEPYTTSINGVSVAVFGASRVIPVPEWRATDTRPGMATAYSPEPLASYVAKWSEQVDYVIPYLHWGQELEEEPDENQIELADALKEAGANLIVGAHPHVLQAMEWNGPKQFTAYSLGNFVFTTSHDARANDTVALEMELTQEEIQRVKVHPAEIRFGLVRYLEEPEERNRILNHLNRLSSQLQFNEEGVAKTNR